MQFPYKKLKCESGSLSGFIFENQNIGLKRGLFLSIEINFSPIVYGEDEWECSLASEWIPFNGGAWKNIEKIDFTDSFVMNMNETTFYMASHDWCDNVSIRLAYINENQFRLHLKATANFSGYFGDDENLEMPIEADIIIPFKGFTIMRDNLFPKPNDTRDAIEVASEFIDIETFQQPFFEDGIFTFEPQF